MSLRDAIHDAHVAATPKQQSHGWGQLRDRCFRGRIGLVIRTPIKGVRLR